MIAKIHTKRYCECPVCHQPEIELWRLDMEKSDHLKNEMKIDCDACGAGVRVRIIDGDAEIEATGERTIPQKMLIKITPKEEPVYLVVSDQRREGPGKDPSIESFERKKYYVEQHTCPTNFLYGITAVAFEGDDDAHGVFDLVAIRDALSEDEEWNYDTIGWIRKEEDQVIEVNAAKITDRFPGLLGEVIENGVMTRNFNSMYLGLPPGVSGSVEK